MSIFLEYYFLRLYLSRISANDDVNEDVLARGTTGFTGAEIENMINQAALKAAGDGFMKVTMAHMEEAKDRVMMGIWFILEIFYLNLL